MSIPKTVLTKIAKKKIECIFNHARKYCMKSKQQHLIFVFVIFVSFFKFVYNFFIQSLHLNTSFVNLNKQKKNM